MDGRLWNEIRMAVQQRQRVRRLKREAQTKRDWAIRRAKTKETP